MRSQSQPKALYDSPESNVKAKGLAGFGHRESNLIRRTRLISKRAGVREEIFEQG